VFIILALYQYGLLFNPFTTVNVSLNGLFTTSWTPIAFNCTPPRYFWQFISTLKPIRTQISYCTVRICLRQPFSWVMSDTIAYIFSNWTVSLDASILSLFVADMTWVEARTLRTSISLPP